jgi:hypothetical protein
MEIAATLAHRVGAPLAHRAEIIKRSLPQLAMGAPTEGRGNRPLDFGFFMAAAAACA